MRHVVAARVVAEATALTCAPLIGARMASVTTPRTTTVGAGVCSSPAVAEGEARKGSIKTSDTNTRRISSTPRCLRPRARLPTMRESNTSDAQANDRVSPDHVRRGPPVFTARGGSFLDYETESQYQDVGLYTRLFWSVKWLSRRGQATRARQAGQVGRGWQAGRAGEAGQMRKVGRAGSVTPKDEWPA